LNILIGGDQHLTNHKPKNRIDDFAFAVMCKFRAELEIAKENHCGYVIFPGDLTESHKENHGLVQKVMDVLNEYPKITVLVVAGQHDQKYHNDDLSGTAFQTLITSGYFHLLGPEPYRTEWNKCDIYGASWKQDIPEIVNPEATNILVTHRMIIDEKLWEAQEDFTRANHLLLKTKFDLIASGDNHQRFTASSGKRHLVNMGSMMRSTIAQINHEPAVTVYDCKEKTITVIPLEIDPIDKVMSLDKAEREKDQKNQTSAFVESVKGEVGSAKIVLSYAEAVEKELEKLDEDDEVADIIEDCFAEE
jgi:DNA repair exonuclease SbcCD nuclease subunit